MKHVLCWLAGAVAGTGSIAIAQCETTWQNQVGEQSVLGAIKAFARWDPDGAGPQPEQLLVGGQFSAVGSSAIANLAMFHPATQVWSAIGGGTDGEVRAIEPLANGGLAIAGDFTQVNGVPAAGVAIWDGVSWNGIGAVTGDALSLTTTATGDLVLGGLFTAVGGTTASNVASWNGTTWSAMGSGLPAAGGIVTIPGVHDLLRMPNGEVVAVGGLTNLIYRFTGGSWVAFPTPPGFVLGLTEVALDSVGRLLVAGTIIGTSSVLRWDGASWTSLGNLDSEVSDLQALPNGDLIACGNANTSGIFQWDGSAWSTLGTFVIFGNRAEVLLPFPGGNANRFFLGGSLSTVQGTSGNGLFEWTGSGWVGDVAGANGFITDLTTFPNGDVFAVGQFTSINGVQAQSIARWGQTWAAVGSGLPFATAVGRTADGTLLAATMNQGVYQLVGSTWQAMPGSPTTSEPCFLLRTNGEVLLGGAQGLWRLNGGTWTNEQSVASVRCMANMPNGDVVLTSPSIFSFPPAQGRIAIWDGGTNWTPLDPTLLVPSPDSVVVMPSGDIVTTGSSLGSVVYYDGTGWAALGSLNGSTRLVSQNSAGELFACGFFTADGATPCPYTARWTGTQWLPIAQGTSNPVSLLAPAANGDSLAIVNVTLFGQTLASHRTACPATAQAYTPACAGAAGTSSLTVTSLPLLGADYAAVASGLSANAIVFDMYGLQAINLPLPSLFAIGQPGCAIAVDPIQVSMATAQNSYQSSLAIPMQPGLIGFDFRHQMLLFDVGPSNNLLAAANTEAIQVTVGNGY